MFVTARNSLFLLFATVLPAWVAAQDELLDEQQAEIQSYTVEVIVFGYSDDRSVGSEIFPADPIQPAAEESELIAELAVVPLARRDPEHVDVIPVLLLPDQLGMLDVFEELERLDAYEPMLHVGWTQPGLARDETIAMPLTAFGPPPAGLEGSFTLYLGRYLHLLVDLALTEADAVAEYTDAAGELHEFEYALPPLEGPVRFRIHEDRILKNGEIRYFDHPKFGVVAKVQRFESVPEQLLQEAAR